MGEVVSFEAFRLALARNSARQASPTIAQESEAPVRVGNIGVATACRGMADGFRQMKAASVMLAEATAELRELVRCDAEGLV